MNKLKIVSYIKNPNKFIKTNFYLNDEFNNKIIG